MFSNRRLLNLLDWAAYGLILLTVFVMPLLMDRNLTNFYVIPKQYAFICLILITVIVFVAKTVLAKKFSVRRSILDIPILIFLVLNLLSAVFSVNRYDSFLGRTNYFVFNMVFLLFSILFYFIIINVVTQKNRWSAILDSLMYVGGIAGVLFVSKYIFQFDPIAWLAPGAVNTVDKISSPFGLLMIVSFILSAGRLIKKDISKSKLIISIIIALVSFACLTMLAFSVLWWLMLAAVILILLVAISFIKEVRLSLMSALFAFVVAIIFFIALGTPAALQAPVPAEISLGFKSSWLIDSNAIFSSAKNFMLGSGPGTFNVDFSKFRAVEFNNDQWVWSLRFSQPLTTVLAFLSESGVFVTLSYIFLIIFAFGHLLNAWFKKGLNLSKKFSAFGAEIDLRMDTVLVAVSWLILSIASFTLFFGPVMWWLWWLLLGLLVVGLSFNSSGVVVLKEWEVEETPQHSLAFSFAMIVLTAGLVLLGVWGGRLYLAEIAYTKALAATDYATAEQNIKKALSHRQNSDIYHAALARVYLMQAVEIVNRDQSSIQLVSSLVAQAVNEARVATDLSPKSVMIWENLAIMYENAASIVPEAREWAIKSWQSAKDLEPTNPVLSWRLGNNYSLSGDFNKAVENYQEALRLKSDYLDAYIGLARNQEALKNNDGAIEAYKNSSVHGGFDNSTILFELGRLLYNRNVGSDRDDAEELWLAAVRIEPTFSNALYSLGLLSEARGEKDMALNYYYQVKELNPDNKDIATKIKSLTPAPVVTPETEE